MERFRTMVFLWVATPIDEFGTICQSIWTRSSGLRNPENWPSYMRKNAKRNIGWISWIFIKPIHLKGRNRSYSGVKTLSIKPCWQSPETYHITGENPRNSPKAAGAFYPKKRTAFQSKGRRAQRPSTTWSLWDKEAEILIVIQLTKDPSRGRIYITEEGTDAKHLPSWLGWFDPLDARLISSRTSKSMR